MNVLRERVTWVWLGLIVLTCATTWGLAAEDPVVPTIAVVGIFVIAAVKVSYVMLDFMELRHAPLPARIAFQAWPIVVVTVIVGLWFAAPAIR